MATLPETTAPLINLPLFPSPTLHLTQPTPAEKEATWRLNGTAWRGALSLEAYLRREYHLASQALTQNGGITYWILVDSAETPAPADANSESTPTLASTTHHHPANPLPFHSPPPPHDPRLLRNAPQARPRRPPRLRPHRHRHLGARHRLRVLRAGTAQARLRGAHDDGAEPRAGGAPAGGGTDEPVQRAVQRYRKAVLRAPGLACAGEQACRAAGCAGRGGGGEGREGEGAVRG